jgi:hypothetical protein
VIEGGNYVSRCKECVSKLIRVRREAARRTHQDNSQTRREFSRLLNTLERKNVWERSQSRVVEYSVVNCQEGIDQVRVCTRETHYGVLEALRES